MTNSKKIAIDVVLLPPEEIMDLCIAINKKAARKLLAHFPLGKEDYIPHISMAVGCIEEKNLKKVKQIVKENAPSFQAMPLQITDLFSVISSSGKKVFALRIRKNNQIQSLHETLMKTLKPWFVDYTHPDALFTKKGEINTGDLDTVSKYEQKYSFEHFDPHITLWCAEAEPIKLPHSFIASTVAICHLGSGTKCRKILFSTSLANK